MDMDFFRPRTAARAAPCTWVNMRSDSFKI